MQIESISKVIDQFNARVNLLTETRLERQYRTYKTKSKNTLGKGFALPTALASVFEPLAKVIEGKDVELLK